VLADSAAPDPRAGLYDPGEQWPGTWHDALVRDMEAHARLLTVSRRWALNWSMYTDTWWRLAEGLTHPVSLTR
jgi:hypothetical protein